MSSFIDGAAGGRIIQLGQLIDEHPTKNPPVPDFAQHVYSFHDPSVEELPGAYPGVTGASDTIFMSTHSGTHMDSLSHIALDGVLYDGSRIDEPGVQDEHRGVRLRTRENFTPIVSRGILLDFPALLGVERVPQDYVITLAEAERCLAAQGSEIRRGDSVLFRVGWDTLMDDNEEYNRMPLPGPDADVARLLVERGVVSTGADTMSYEAAPGTVPLEVHAELIPRNGIHIFEMMDLRELSASGVREFLFIAAPLRLRGGTGSPINPLAVLPAA
jgi:kynurenine formamidase